MPRRCPTLSVTGLAILAAVAMFANPKAAAQVSFASAYEHLGQIDPDVIRSYLEPCIGTLERAREFERMLRVRRIASSAGPPEEPGRR